MAADASEDYRLRMEALRKSLDDAVAEANEKGWLTEEEVFGELEAMLAAPASKRGRPASRANRRREP